MIKIAKKLSLCLCALCGLEILRYFFVNFFKPQRAQRHRESFTGIAASSQKRPLILLEVLIAFALVALCVLPLIYPQVFILKSEREFVDTIELDHAVNLLYGNRLQKLYLNEIGWDEIEEERRIPITEAMMMESGVTRELPFNGEYQFFIIKRKPPKPDDRLYLVSLVFSFTSKKAPKKVNNGDSLLKKEPKKLTYSYDIFIERRPKKVKEDEVKPEADKENTP